MTDDTCMLTTKDFTILEVMRERCLGRDDPLAPLLDRKMESARVVFSDDIPENVATLNSRVTFCAGAHDADTRILSHDQMQHAPVGMFLPIKSLRGLALLGLSEGQEFVLRSNNGVEERVALQKVRYQPEAAKRRQAAEKRAASAPRKPALKLVHGAGRDVEPSSPTGTHDFDGPGPTAA